MNNQYPVILSDSPCAGWGKDFCLVSWFMMPLDVVCLPVQAKHFQCASFIPLSSLFLFLQTHFLKSHWSRVSQDTEGGVPRKTVSASLHGLAAVSGEYGIHTVVCFDFWKHFSPKAKALTEKTVLTCLLGSLLIFKGEWRSQNVCTFSKQAWFYLQ